jgi:hypothetical protein
MRRFGRFVGACLVLSSFLIGPFVAAQEFYCEGFDDDGDFEIDEGCPRTCDRLYFETGPRAVAPGSTGAAAVSIVRPGTGYAWAYADTRSGTSQVYVQITATSGAPDKPEVRVSNGTNPATDPTIVLRSPSTYGVVWVDERTGNPDVWFRVLDSMGTPASGSLDTNVSGNNTASLNPSVVWNGSGFAVVWDDTKGSNRDIYFQRLDALGGPLGNSIRVTSATSLQEDASIAWDGTQYAVVWTDERDGNREIYGQRIDGTGSLVGSAVRLTSAAGTSQRPSVVALSSGRFGVAWEDARSGQAAVWYAPWEGPGWSAVAGSAVSASTGAASIPSLTTTGAEVLLAWRDTRHGGGDLYARRLGYDGTALSSEIRLTADGLVGSAVSASWHGSGFGVAHLSASGPRLSLAACGGTDLDGDGYFADEGDCNDQSDLQSPAVPESCDALDNTCDGVTDEGCPGTCDARVAGEPVDIHVPTESGPVVQVVSGSGGYGVAWQDRETYPGCCIAYAPYFRTLDFAGAPASPSVRATTSDLSGEKPWIAWSGAAYAIVWESYNRTDFVARIGFRRFGADGAPLGPHREVTTDPVLPFGHRRPVLVWGPNEFALTFMDIAASGVPRANQFVRLDRDGRPLERARDIGPDPSELAHLAFNGVGYGLSYLSWVDPYFRKLDRFGGYASDAVAIRNDPYNQGKNRVAATPWGYGVTWAEDTGPVGQIGEIFYQRFDVAGVPVAGPVRLTAWANRSLNAYEHTLVWTGANFLVFAFEYDGRENMTLFRFDADGVVLGEPLTVYSGDPALPSGSPWLAWNGVEPLAVWSDSEEGGLNHTRPRSRHLLCCETQATPSPVSGVSWQDPSTLTWTTSGVPTYDRVRGSLSEVRERGSLDSTVYECKRDLTTSSTEFDQPHAGLPFYFLVRGVGICGPSSWNGPSPPQQGDRDADLAGDPQACP